MRLPTYLLSVTFKSNERPFHTKYDPWPQEFETDADAIEWAKGMSEGLGGAYTTTLLKHGQPLVEE